MPKGCALVLSLLLVAMTLPCQAQRASEQEKNKTVARTFFEEVLGQGKLEKYSDFHTADFVGHSADGDFTLADDLAAAREERKAMPDMQIVVNHIVAEGDLVVVHWTAWGTNTQPGMGLPATGKPVNVSGMTLFRFKGGKISDEWNAWSMLSVLKQLGLLCPEVPHYVSDLESARNESIKTDSVSIQSIELGQAHPGRNHFSALATNSIDDIVIVGLDLRADGGLLVQKHQEQFIFLIYPHEQKKLEAEYEFPHLWPDATLRVRFAFPEVGKNGMTDFKDYFFDKSYSVGAGNKAVDFDPAKFQKRDSQHFEVSCFPDSLASKELGSILEKRELGFQKISATLGVTYSQPIRIFFFPDAASKKDATGHTGDGFAFENNIVEVYNEKTKMDPYHELTHILAGQLGDPPAAFNEGLAVYMSESLGADALKNLGSPGKTVDEAVVAARSQGRIITLETLLTFTDIGPEESNPQVSYPEAASLVKFLIKSYGLEKFRLAYSSLKNANDPQGIEANRQTFKRIYGAFPQEIEGAWLAGLAKRQE